MVAMVGVEVLRCWGVGVAGRNTPTPQHPNTFVLDPSLCEQDGADDADEEQEGRDLERVDVVDEELASDFADLVYVEAGADGLLAVGGVGRAGPVEERRREPDQQRRA